MDIERLPCLMVLDDQLAITLERDIGQAGLTPCPTWRDTGFLKENLLVVVVAGKDIVEAQGAIVKTFIKRLGTHGDCRHSDK